MTMAKKAKAKAKTTAARRTAGTRVPMHAVVHFIRMLQDRKHAAKFIAHAKRSKASITVPPKGVNFINSFMKDHSLPNARAAKSIDPCPTGDPWKCNS
jgi:hypothetical protein